MLRFQPLSHLSKDQDVNYNTIYTNLSQLKVSRNSNNMKKSIEVIIKQKSHYAEDPIKRLKKVSPGYAFNYLIPNKIAEVATKRKIEHLKRIQKTVLKKKNQFYNNSLLIKKDLEKISILHIRKKCSQNGQIFGTISKENIVVQIFKFIGQTINKKQISVETFKKIGTYKAIIMLEHNLSAQIEINILPKNI